MTDQCLFCRIINKTVPADIVFENNTVLAFKDIHPQAPVHLLVIPRKHISSLSDISVHDKDIIFDLFQAAQQLTRIYKIDTTGYRSLFNCGPHAGQAVFHLHLHVLGGRQLHWPPG